MLLPAPDLLRDATRWEVTVGGRSDSKRRLHPSAPTTQLRGCSWGCSLKHPNGLHLALIIEMSWQGDQYKRVKVARTGAGAAAVLGVSSACLFYC